MTRSPMTKGTANRCIRVPGYIFPPGMTAAGSTTSCICCNGDKDIAYADQKGVMEKTLPVCPQLKKGVNYDFYVIPGGVHDMKAWQLHLYHALQIFFRA